MFYEVKYPELPVGSKSCQHEWELPPGIYAPPLPGLNLERCVKCGREEWRAQELEPLENDLEGISGDLKAASAHLNATIERTIQQAVLAERERAAKIADAEAERARANRAFQIQEGDEDENDVWISTAESIAANIREGK